jgi:hypothetical protein
MTWIRHNPVMALTSLYTILAAVDAVLIDAHALPSSVLTVVTGAVAVLAAILGAVTHTKVTPVIDPKNDEGVPLVPVGRTTLR